LDDSYDLELHLRKSYTITLHNFITKIKEIGQIIVQIMLPFVNW
jgi:hypothetical protein